MPTYDIWSEGYIVTGDHGTAIMMGTSKGTDFKDACVNFFADPYNLHNYKNLFDVDRLTFLGMPFV